MEDESELPLVEHQDHRPTPEKQVESQEAQEILEWALQMVKKPNHRVAWILRHLEGCSIAEISQTLQRKEGDREDLDLPMHRGIASNSY